MDIRPMVAKGFDLWSPQIITGGMEGFGRGTVQLEYGWQLISVPVAKGYWDSDIHEHVHDNITIARFKNYILDQITDLYGNSVVEVANTFLGDNQFFYSYVVGVTPESSSHNWQLVYEDDGNFEISGAWINIIGSNAPYLISWGES